jgi:hypothetical protein
MLCGMNKFFYFVGAMNNRFKTIAALSVICILAIVFHFLHDTYTANSTDDPFKGTPAHVIWKDQSGKTDTLLLTEHIETPD